MQYRINYEFYDIHALLVYFRVRPEQLGQFVPALETLRGTMQPSEPPQMAEETVRVLLRSCWTPEDAALDWVEVDNRYTANIFVMKNAAHYALLAAVLQELLNCAGDEARTVLLCDAVHNIPLLLCDKPHPHRVIERYLSDYRKTYNKAFLKAECRALR